MIMLASLSRILALAIVTLVVSITPANAKTLAKNQIQYGRLSPDVLETDPLFNVISAGLPTGDYIALLSTQNSSCLLDIINARENKTIFTITDHKSCAEDFEFEDSYAINHAHQFQNFLNTNFKIIKQLLTRYKIDHSKFPEAVAQPGPVGGNTGQCVRLAKLRICRDKDLKISMP